MTIRLSAASRCVNDSHVMGEHSFLPFLVNMARYPALTPGVVHLAPVFTLAKWIFVTGSFVLLLIGSDVALWRWAMTRGRR